jgi:hypothetical protein
MDEDRFELTIKQAYGLNVQDEGHRTIQSIFLSVAVKHSLALSAGPERTLFNNLLGQGVRFGCEYNLAMNWRIHVWKR